MKTIRYAVLYVLFALSLAGSSAEFHAAQKAPAASDATLKAIATAKAFLAALDGRQLALQVAGEVHAQVVVGGVDAVIAAAREISA